MKRRAGFAQIATFAEANAFFGDLLVFVDETGDEALGDPTTPFGFGACVVMYDDYATLVAEPWRHLEEEHRRGDERPFHATRDLCDETVRAAVDGFFRARSFRRVAAVVTRTTERLAGSDVHETALQAFHMQLVELCAHMTFRRIVLVFEDSQRGNPKVDQNGWLRVSRLLATRDGVLVGLKPVPVRGYSLRKSAREPGMAVADVIAHAATAQTRVLANARLGPGLTDAVFARKTGLSRFVRVDWIAPVVDATG